MITIQYITTPTHVDGGLLDLVFCNNTALIHSYETIQPLRSTSDHFVMEVSTRLLSNAADEEEKPVPLWSPFDSLYFFSIDREWGKISNELLDRFADKDLSSLPPNEHSKKIMKIFVEVAYKYVPTKRTARKGSRTRIPRERRILMRKRRKLMERLAQASSEVRKGSVRFP